MRRAHIVLLFLALPIAGAACTSIIGLPDVPGAGDGGNVGPALDGASGPDSAIGPVDDGGTGLSSDGGTGPVGDGALDSGQPMVGMDGNGGCPAGVTTCGAGCVNETTDQHNCGGCGLDCPVACASGRCIVALVENQAIGQGWIAVDLTNVYWTTSGGSVESVPVGGGAVTPIATGQPGPSGMATNGSQVFWANSNGSGTGTTAIESSVVPPLTPGVYPLATTGFMMADPGPIALNGNYVYFTDINGGSTYVMKAAIDAQGPAILVTPGTTEMFGVAADDNSVYWTNYGGGTVQKTGHDGGAPVTIGKGLNFPLGIAIDANNAYVTTGAQTIVSMPLNGTGDQVTTIGHANTISVATDSQYVYWTVTSCPDAGTCPTLQKVPVDGGATITLAEGPGGVGIAVDQTSAYYTSDGGIVKVTPK